MKKTMILSFIAAMLAAGCVAVPGRHGEVVVVPFLPPVVVLGEEPYYHHEGFYYHYSHDRRWYYSRSRRGPWSALPRDHYPKEVRRRGRERRHYRY